jgi:hypothetical protein
MSPIPIDNNIANWKTYVSSKVNYSFKYPQSAILDSYLWDTLTPRLSILFAEQKVDSLPNEMPLGEGKISAQERQSALQLGKFGSDSSFGFKDSQKVINLGEVNAQDYIVFRMLEVCNMQFTRKLVFYKNGYEVRIDWVLNIPIDKKNKNEYIENISNHERYFEINTTSCFGYIWKADMVGTSNFYKDLVIGAAPTEFQNWYNSFDKMLSTFKFTDQSQRACTQEAKLCPDGKTSVGRTGPNCEFAPCP